MSMSALNDGKIKRVRQGLVRVKPNVLNTEYFIRNYF